jgi:hypothetical protein
MAGCEARNPGGDESAGIKEVLKWVLLGATIGAAAATSAGGLGWVTGVFGAAIGSVVGFGVGRAIQWFSRLKEQSPRTIQLNGHIECAGRNTGGWPAWGMNDGDWTFNLGVQDDRNVESPAGLSLAAVRTRVAPGASAAFESVDPGSGVGILHCEISSAIGTGAAIGAPIGAVAGVIAGAILCAALGWVTFGLACLLAILLGAILGETLGELIAAGIGAIADALSDFDRKGEGIERCCTVVFRGRWVTDTSHQHNEIHDIDSIQIVGCGVGSTQEGLFLAGAVGIGRIPTGRDP